MSDLISRKKIRDYIKGEINPYGKPFEGTAYELGLKIMRYIDAMDSDYDIDNVVEELEKRKQEYLVGFGIHDNNEMYGVACGLGDAIEIVKHGGVSDDVCEWEKDEHSENDNPAEWIICPHKQKRIFSKDIKYCPYCGKKIKVVV